MTNLRPHTHPVTHFTKSQTIRQGAPVSVATQYRWVKRPESRHGGWHRAILEINRQRYDAESFFTHDDDTGHVWQVIDLRHDDVHHRLTIGPEGTLCDCGQATFRGVTCKHVAAIQAALDQLDTLERAEWYLTEAQACLDLALAEVAF